MTKKICYTETTLKISGPSITYNPTDLPSSKYFCCFLCISRIHPPLTILINSSPGFLLDYCKSLSIALSSFKLFSLGIGQNLEMQISSCYFTFEKSPIAPHSFANENRNPYFELAPALLLLSLIL